MRYGILDLKAFIRNLQFIPRPITMRVYEGVQGRNKLGPTSRFPRDWTKGQTAKNQRNKLLNLKMFIILFKNLTLIKFNCNWSTILRQLQIHVQSKII